MKAQQIKRIEQLYRKKIDPRELLSNELAKHICALSREIKRQLGILIDRQGKVVFVIIGTAHEIEIPRLSDYRVDPGRLRGLRCIHTHLNGETLTQDDLTDLALLRLDIIAAIEVSNAGLPGKVHSAHVIPEYKEKTPWMLLPPRYLSDFKLDCEELIWALESELSRNLKNKKLSSTKRAILISVTQEPRHVAEESLEELEELARTNNIDPIEKALMRPRKINAKFLMGSGQLKELAIKCLSMGADTLLFNQNLSPAQAHGITDTTELIVMDRTQLILEIFGERAHSADGKTKVELAQLKYALPRLSTKDDALSRIRGGIGLRGPGETKMEIGKRRISDRITALEKKLTSLAKGRDLQKKARIHSDIPLVSIVGYTNSGKSTLLNLLTGSTAYVQDKLFATLDPTTRNLHLPNNQQIIISDTVGFIRDLPTALLDSFRSTLEELHSANLLIHLVDINSSHMESNIRVVENILSDLNLHRIPILTVFNKADKHDQATTELTCNRYSAIPISAKTKYNIPKLLDSICDKIFDGASPQ